MLGLNHREDLFPEGAPPRQWEDLVSRGAQQRSHRAFLALMANSMPVAPLGDPELTIRVVLLSIPITEGNLAWEFQIPNGQMKESWLLGELGWDPKLAFIISDGILKKVDMCPVVGVRLFRMVTGAVLSWSMHKVGRGVITPLAFDLSGSDRYRWRDGRGFFHALTASILRLMQNDSSNLCGGLRKWRPQKGGPTCGLAFCQGSKVLLS